MATIDHDKDRAILARDQFDKRPGADEIGGDPTGVMTGVDPGEEPIRPGEPAANESPRGDDPTGGHGAGRR